MITILYFTLCFQGYPCKDFKIINEQHELKLDECKQNGLMIIKGYIIENKIWADYLNKWSCDTEYRP